MSTSVPPPGFEPPPDSESAAITDTAVPAASTSEGPRRRFRIAIRSRLLAGGLVLIGAVAGAFVLLGSANGPVSDPIAQAATLSSSTPGYRMNLAMTVTAPGLSAPLTGSGSAIVDLRDRAFSMSLSLDLSGEPQAAQALGSDTLSFTILMDRGAVYVRLPAAAMQDAAGLDGKPWLKVDISKLGGVPDIGSLGSTDPTMSDPSRMLQYLRAASSSIANDGDQQVDGVQTTHYHAVLSLQDVAAGLPASERSAVQRALSLLQQATGNAGLPIDVWIDSQHLVRRIALSLSLHAGTADLVHEGVTADLTDYGPQPQPTLPPADQVQDVTSLPRTGL